MENSSSGKCTAYPSLPTPLHSQSESLEVGANTLSTLHGQNKVNKKNTKKTEKTFSTKLWNSFIIGLKVL
jgi:hypothetical protein